MENSRSLDITFEFRSDTPQGKDPDALSPTLRRYHRFLWSKPLPNGVLFELVDTTPGVYLHHRSRFGEFWLASDAVIPTFRKEARMSASSRHATSGFRLGGQFIGWLIG